MVGQVLGHYQIEAKVGEGVSSTVYKGFDVRLKRTVAVKVLNEKFLHEGPAWGRLLREARIASALNHPNICTIYDIGEDQDINYVVFEFVEGKTLRALLESGPLPIQAVFQYGMQIAEAKAYINAAGVLHRDLKSSNIMVTPGGQIKIVDFGIAKFLQVEKAKRGEAFGSTAQEVGCLIGTLPYVAPEVLHGEAPTAQAGVWSLGAILFEMLTGQLPYAGRTSFELGMDIMAGQIKRLPMDIPAGLRGIVQRCLVRDKAHRYYSAVEVLNDLQSEYVSFQIRGILAKRRYAQKPNVNPDGWRLHSRGFHCCSTVSDVRHQTSRVPVLP